jgi:hypothetical protein
MIAAGVAEYEKYIGLRRQLAGIIRGRALTDAG